jgi:hypothetical protein
VKGHFQSDFGGTRKLIFERAFAAFDRKRTRQGGHFSKGHIPSAVRNNSVSS